MQSLITIHHISYELPNGRILFRNLNFSLGAKLTALVGPNGVGKTTLARLIATEISPTEGDVQCAVPVTFFRQREEPPEQSVEDYLSTRYVWSLLGEQLLVNVNRSILCNQLSGGQWMRVRLAATICDQFLILDEPTNDLDREAKNVLLNFLHQYQYGILLISHDREFLFLCEDVLELSNQGLEKYGGGWKSYEEMRGLERHRVQQDLARAKGEREKAKKERHQKIKMQEKRSRQGAMAARKGGIPKILLGARKRRAQITTGKVDVSTLQRAEEKVEQAYEIYKEMKVDSQMYADLHGEELPKQKLIAEATDFNVFYDRWLYPHDLNFSWRGNIRLAIKGDNGAGKTTLMEAILGKTLKKKGELRLGQLKILYLDQRCSILDETKSVLENVQASAKMSEGDIRNALAKFLFFGESVHQRIQTLSGGERLRAALACGLLREEKSELMILDEPTNNLDLINIKFLENLVASFRGAVIAISHDETFLKECGIEKEFLL